MAAAVEHHGKREWLVHGPDLDTGYGSFQGLGGLEAIVNEATGETTPIVDTVHGHVVATIDLGVIGNSADDTVVFKEQQFGGYGPLPGSQQKPLEVTESLSESLGWQTRYIDPTSFFAMGARHYGPLSGRFLSADPLGHGATPDLYSYAGGDPLNFFDPTGRKFKPGDPIGKDMEISGIIEYKGEQHIYTRPIPQPEESTEAPDNNPWQVVEDAAEGKRYIEEIGYGTPEEYLKDVAIFTGKEIAIQAGTYMAGGVIFRVVDGKVTRILRKNDDTGSYVARPNTKEYGSYTNHHQSGKKYHGQGDKQRSQISGKEKTQKYDDPHSATEWTPANNRREAMKDEAKRIKSDGGIENPNNYNQINSPGKKYLEQDSN